MSRSGYTDEFEDPLAIGRWQAAVSRSLRGRRGQAFLRELVDALDAMDDRRLFPGSFATADGEFCTLGIVGARRGTPMDDLGDEGYCDTQLVGERFDISPAMAAEIMYLNDEYMTDSLKWTTIEVCGPMQPHRPDWGEHLRDVQVPNENHPAERWQRMRAWALKNLATPNDRLTTTRELR